MSIPFDMLDRLGSAVQHVILDTIGWPHALHIKTRGYHAFSKLTHANRLFEHDGCPAKNFLSFLFDIQETFTSTDSRDKIFAFLGLKKNLEPPVVLPDYSRNAAEVFADAAISFIQTSSTLDVLGLVEGNEKWLCICQNQIPNLPSWAPNWTQKFHGVRPFYFVDFPNQFRSSKGYKHEYVDSGVPGRLLVKGKQVASIRSIFPVSFDGKNSYFGVFGSFFSSRRSWTASQRAVILVISSRLFCEPFLRTAGLVMSSHCRFRLSRSWMSWIEKSF
jgi:hypothetical protein